MSAPADVQSNELAADPVPVRRLGLAAAAAVLIVDQASKLGVLSGLDLDHGRRIGLLPVIDLTLVWNRGISYGLLQQGSGLGRGLLIAFTLVAIAAVTVWLWRSVARLPAVSLGLILGGAAGNLVDRLTRGAVVDFIHFHVGAFSWYVFNLADAAIVIGVAGLLIDAVFREHARGQRHKRPESGKV